MELKKGSCPYCGLFMLKQNIKRHINYSCRRVIR